MAIYNNCILIISSTCLVLARTIIILIVGCILNRLSFRFRLVFQFKLDNIPIKVILDLFAKTCILSFIIRISNDEARN